MHYVVIPVLGFVLLVALLWDMWIQKDSLKVRSLLCVQLTLLFLGTALVALLFSAPSLVVAGLLAASIIACISPAMEVFAFAKNERNRARKSLEKPSSKVGSPPFRLIDADHNLKLQYDDLVQRFEVAPSMNADQALLEEGRALAKSLSQAARMLGTSRAYEMSQDIPILTYWAADVARRNYPEGDETRTEYERSLEYYSNFDSSAWLWELYRTTPRSEA